MMKAFRIAAILAVFLATATAATAAAAEPVKVVATFSILGDMAARVGGDRIALTTLVGADGDAHVYEPSPAAAMAVAEADLVVANGLGFEGWIERLAAASGFDGELAVLSRGAELIEGDPHAWQDIGNAIVYVRNIAAALCRADAAGCDFYRRNADAYAAELAALHGEIAARFSAIPAGRRRVITSHDAFAYLGRAYGIAFLAPKGVSTDAEASAADVAALIRQIRSEGATALFVENIADPRLIEQIGRETGARPGGALFSDALSGPDGPAPTYAAMMRHNAETLAAALSGR